MMKLAVIGVGHLGKIHARIYHQLPGIELVAVVDQDKDRAEEVASQYATKALTDYRQIVGQVDAVSVATPTNQHYEIANYFLEHKVHVLVEKPITFDPTDAEKLVSLAHKNNVKLQVGHTERFNPIVMEIAARNLHPTYIEAKRFSPFRFRSGDIGVVFDLMVHDIDIITSLVKSKVSRIESTGINLLGAHDDIANARIVFESGCIADITASRVAKCPRRKAKIFSTTSYVEVDYADSTATLYQLPPHAKLEELNLQGGVPEQYAGLSFEEIFYGKMMNIEEVKPDKHEPLYVQLQSFIEAIEQDTRPVVSGEDGLETVRIADIITKQINEKIALFKQL